MIDLKARSFWLIPSIYIIHNIEEYSFLKSFAVSRDVDSLLAQYPDSIIYASILGVAFFILLWAYRVKPWAEFWYLAGVAALFTNGIAHFSQAIYYRGYVPGLVTSLALYLPLGGMKLLHAYRNGLLPLSRIPKLILLIVMITAVTLALSFGLAMVI